MKKYILILLLAFGLTGCQSPEVKKDTSESVENISKDNYIQEQIKILQFQIEKGEITESYAQEKLKNIIEENKKLNDGSTESILQKLSIMDPTAAEVFEKKIRENHPNEFKD